jgi:UDP-2-acetamido-3-amino-2,3-dideoxy-glucuronate N-acetyltransferase
MYPECLFLHVEGVEVSTSSIRRGDIAPTATIAASAKVWDDAQVRENAVIGDDAIIGRGAYIGIGVHVGRACKIQNHALVYEPARLADGVFIGPNVVLTNDRFPRAVTPTGALKSASDWIPVGVVVNAGASIGAHSVCIAPVTIGAWAVVGAGSVVTRDVAPFALVHGNPARRIGWVGRSGHRLVIDSHDPELWQCPATGSTYRIVDDVVTELSA